MSKGLRRNIGFLGISQMANYILPLITIPYITRIVGPANYGLIEFATTAMLYFSAIVIYGFGTTGTRMIAGESGNMQRVSKIFSTVFYTRLMLLAASTLVFILCWLFIPRFREESLLMWAAFPVVIGWALYPEFLFQGMQKLQFVAGANFAVKALAALMIFMLLQNPEDYYLVLAINALSQIVVAAVLLWGSFKLIPGLHLEKFQSRAMWQYLREGSYQFLSNFFVRLSRFSSLIFVGFFLLESQMGLYAASAKLIMVAYSFLFLPLSGAMFPYLANVLRHEPSAYLIKFRKAFFISLAISGVSTLILWLFPDFFLKLVFGEAYLPAAPYLQIMAPALLFASINHFSMQQGLVVLGKDRIYLNIIIVVGLITTIFNLTLIEPFGLSGASYIKLSVDVLLALFGSYYFLKCLRKSAARPEADSSSEDVL